MQRGTERPHAGFTIVELVVVITVIALLLAIVIPGLSAISSESRFSSAVQQLNGTVTRAYYYAVGDGRMTALRFVRGDWDQDPSAEQQLPRGRMHVVTMSYTGTTAANPEQPENIEFGEYFERRPDTESQILPDDIWAAPLAAQDAQPGRYYYSDANGEIFPTPATVNNLGRDFVLKAQPAATLGQPFLLNAGESQGLRFAHADDFLIVFDPASGLRTGLPAPMPLKAYDPVAGYERAVSDGFPPIPFQRYSFSGIVVYRRDPFLALNDLSQTVRAGAQQDHLRREGRPFLVHPFGGGLVMGSQYGQ